jgi:hypothetical protein
LQLDGKHALTGLGIGLLLPRDAALAALGLAADHLPVLIRFRDALRAAGQLGLRRDGERGERGQAGGKSACAGHA